MLRCCPLNKSDYVNKMNETLDDQSKFERHGPVSNNDNTAIIESRPQKRLLDLTHKEGTPLRSVLSMTGSSHHELGKWLAAVLQPVLKRFSSQCILDSFAFAKTMQNLDIDPYVFMCSFDASSLFTNFPLDETIKICSDALYDDSDLQPLKLIPKDVFVELMKSTTSSVEFSFNNTMYKQTDGVAIRSPFGPGLANFFVEYYEEKLFSQMQKPPTYFRYVDDTFAIFDHEADKFLTKLNCLHPFLKLTFENEKGKCLPFLDVYVERTDIGLETSVYQRPTFTGQYLRWESFSPLKRKISLISTLVRRALMTCTKRKLNGEIERSRKYYWTMAILKTSSTLRSPTKSLIFPPLSDSTQEKCPVYLRVPWIGKPSINLEKEVKTAVESCYGSVSTRLIFTSKRMLPVARKDVLPTTHKSSVIYEYKCYCDSRYVGRTSQRLQDCIKQHVPQWLRQQTGL